MSEWPGRNARLTDAAKQTWEFLFNEPMPDRIVVRWKKTLHNLEGQATIGAIHRGGRIELDWTYLQTIDDPLSTLVHEFAHARGFARHGVRFKQHVNRWLRKLSLSEEQ